MKDLLFITGLFILVTVWTILIYVVLPVSLAALILWCVWRFILSA